MTPNKLTEFSLFPRLPIELRRKIYKHATLKPNALRVSVVGLVSDPEFGLYFTFEAPSSTPTDVALLSTCSESREVYLENNTNSLPNGLKGLIRYDAKHTTIFIDNFDQLMKDFTIATAVREGWRRQKWILEVKKMAVPVSCFVGDIDGMWCTGSEGRGEFLRIFENLEEWKGLITDGFKEGLDEGFLKLMFCDYALVTQKELEIYRKTYNQGYKVPKVFLMDLVL